MLRIPVPSLTEEDSEKLNESISHQDIINEREDALRTELQCRMDISNDKILIGARLIAPVVEEKSDWEGGYRWIIDQLRSDFDHVLSKFEIDLSMMFMRKRRFEDAISILKNFEKKDMSLRAIAGTNLSFIYFLDYAQAEKYADVAIKADRYNAKALVIKVTVCMYLGNLPVHVRCILRRLESKQIALKRFTI